MATVEFSIKRSRWFLHGEQFPNHRRDAAEAERAVDQRRVRQAVIHRVIILHATTERGRMLGRDAWKNFAVTCRDHERGT